MPYGIDEILTIRLLTHPVNAEMRSGFVGHHISATSELRAGVVKAEAAGSSAARALTTSSKLDADHVMADATSTGKEISAPTLNAFVRDLR
jgi:hypothetical protein